MSNRVNILSDMRWERGAAFGVSLGEGSSRSLKKEKTKPEQELGSPSGYYLDLPDNCKYSKRKSGYGNLKRGNVELEDILIHNLSFITHNSPQALRGLGYGV